MVLSDTTNSSFDTQCAAVPTAVGGALTRVSDIDADPVISPNSQIKYETTSVSGITVNISYDEMLDTNVRDKVVLEAHGLQGVLKKVFDFIAALDVFNDHGGFNPFTVGDDGFMAFMRLFQTNIVPILDSIPLEAWTETAPKNPLLAAFTEVFSDPDNTVTNTSNQEPVSAFIWDWGDGEYDVTWQPSAAHSYGSSDTYTTRLILVGPAGVSIASGAANVVS